jgi:phosphoribosylformylglycinamidine (FGAM) synthase-like enzyme
VRNGEDGAYIEFKEVMDTVQEEQPVVLGSHPEFKEPVILGSPTIRGVGGASVGSAASGQGGRRDARSEQQGGSGGMWRRRWPAGLRAMTRRCTHAA